MVTDRDLYAATVLRVAADIGYDNLACILNVTVEDVGRWACGRVRPPIDAFIQIINMSNSHSPPRSMEPESARDEARVEAAFDAA